MAFRKPGIPEMGQGVIIIGAGHAGGMCAAYLRQFGYEDAITLIGIESHPPYQRPPLSKAWLKGEASGHDLALKSDDFYREARIGLRLNQKVAQILPDQGKVVLSDETELSYAQLVIATGSRPQPFAADPDQLGLYLRTLDEADDLKQRLYPGQRLGLIGAGYVGLEVAASAVAIGCTVTLFEREDRILSRVASKPLSEFFHRIHTEKSVSIRTGARVTILSRTESGGVEVRLAEGPALEFDTVLTGIGALPDDALAQAAGLTCQNGIVVDEDSLTSQANIYAIGDVTSREIAPYYQGRYRLESVPNALEQARRAASHICGRPRPAPEVPWFWSDQYNLKLQIAGLLSPAPQIIQRGDVASQAFSLLHLDSQDRLICAECVNQPAEFMAAKLLIAQKTRLDKERLADNEVSLKSFMQV